MNLKIPGILFVAIVGISIFRLMSLPQVETAPLTSIQLQIQSEPETEPKAERLLETPTSTETTSPPTVETPPKVDTPPKAQKSKQPVVTAIVPRSQILAAQAHDLDANVVRLALVAYEKAKSQNLVNKPMLTVIDYSKKSVEKRLWVFDLNTNELLIETYVTHGEGSGKKRATRFSNEEGTHRTSIGVFTTAEAYRGMFGYSLRLDGHEEGFNDQARKRAIVIHGADYASERYIEKHGRLGTSFACPAVDTEIAPTLIDTIKEGSLIFAFYPNRKWLKSSAFLDLE